MKKLPIEVDHSEECFQLGDVDWWWHVGDCLDAVVHGMQSFSVDSVAQVYNVWCHIFFVSGVLRLSLVLRALRPMLLGVLHPTPP